LQQAPKAATLISATVHSITLITKEKPLGILVGARDTDQNIPSILKPNFDLLGLDVLQDGALFDQLVTPDGAGFGALMVHPLQGFHLFVGVANVLS